MKKIAYLMVFALLAAVSCSQKGPDEDVVSTKTPLKALSVQVGSSYYHAVIDQYAQRAEIGALEDLASITGVDYELGSETASIWPDPKEFIGNWQKSQIVVVTDGGKETAYEIVFTYYDDEPGVAPKPSEPEPEPEPEENVIFFDDFDEGEHPNEEYWQLCVKANSAWNQHFVNDRDWANEQIAEIDGVSVLVLTAQKVGGTYSNAGIRSKFGVELNTRLEVRARFEKAGGGFPAIWQMPLQGLTWPRSGEIDLMEGIQGNPNLLWHTIHVATSATNNADKSSSRQTTVSDTDVYRVYGVERTAEAVTFYVDGEKVWSYTNQHLDDGGVQYPFASYDYDIILNYSFGGPLANGSMTWPGAIKDADFPASMYVDWVKVVKLDVE